MSDVEKVEQSGTEADAAKAESTNEAGAVEPETVEGGAAEQDGAGGETEATEPVAEGEANGAPEAPEGPVAQPQQAAEDRRKTYRLNKVLGATLRSGDDSKNTRLFIIDLSASGFRATDHQPPGQEECEISIVLVKGEEPFTSRMRVVWVKELTVSGMYQMGCEFIDPPEDQVTKLTDFIEGERSKVEKPAALEIKNPWTMIN